MVNLSAQFEVGIFGSSYFDVEYPQVLLSHPLVDGGSSVVLNCDDIKFGWKNLVSKSPSEGKYDVTPGSFGGFENPLITVSGKIDIHSIDSNELDQEKLVSFAIIRSNTLISMYVTAGSSITSMTGFYSGQIDVRILDFSIVPDFGSDQGHIWNYTINFVESL